ncbi:MAG: porin [Verrucomicrobiota bacterium]|nr:porin [Verrucomicrobiota bacterium]
MKPNRILHLMALAAIANLPSHRLHGQTAETAEPPKLQTRLEAQGRLVVNSRHQSGEDDDVHGFLIRRARADFQGHAGNPDWTYRARVNANTTDGNVKLEYAYIGMPLPGGFRAEAGQIKPQFAREESVNAFRQLAVERSYTADYFTVDFTQGAELSKKADRARAFLALHDGSYAANTDFSGDRTELGIAGRIEFMPAGRWEQFADFSSARTDGLGCLLGLALDYEIGEEGAATYTPDILKATADASLEVHGFTLFGALYGQKFDDHDENHDSDLPDNLADAEQYGIVLQAGTLLPPEGLELFGRAELIEFDNLYYRNKGEDFQKASGSLASDPLTILTTGLNYHMPKYNTKLSLDLVWALDPVPCANTGSGLLDTLEDDQSALRAQLQWRF